MERIARRNRICRIIGVTVSSIMFVVYLVSAFQPIHFNETISPEQIGTLEICIRIILLSSMLFMATTTVILGKRLKNPQKYEKKKIFING